MHPIDDLGILKYMKTIIITGVSRGIGREFAIQYAGAGNRVFGVLRNPEGHEDLEALGITLIQGDVTDESLTRRITDILGDQQLDLCINNAGILPAPQPDGFPSTEDLMRSFATNVTGPMNMIRGLRARMKSGGKFVMLSSSLASITDAGHDYATAYSVSKAALNMLGRKIQHRIPEPTVILMDPGWVKTDMGGAGAALEIPDSVSSMIGTIEATDSFAFLDYAGNSKPW